MTRHVRKRTHVDLLSKGQNDILISTLLNSKVHGANMGPIWGRQDPGVPHVGPMKYAIWVPLISTVTIPAVAVVFSF